MAASQLEIDIVTDEADCQTKYGSTANYTQHNIAGMVMLCLIPTYADAVVSRQDLQKVP